MKNSSDSIGNRTRDFPACSVVHQLPSPLRYPVVLLRTNVGSKAIMMRQRLLSVLEIWQRAKKKFSVTWCCGLVTMKTVNSANGSVTSPPRNHCNQVARSNSPATMAVHTVAKMVWRPMETGNHDNKVWFTTNTGLSKKMDGIWNRYNLKSTGRIYTFCVLKCSENSVLDLP